MNKDIHMKPGPDFGLVIFSKDEAPTIADVIDGASRYVALNDIFIIDGYSRDRTVPIVQDKGAHLLFDEGQGKGSAIRLAIREINRDILIFMDSDGSHRPEELPQFFRIFAEHPHVDLVVASRFKGGSEELNGSWMEILRFMGNKLSTALINVRWHSRLTEVQNGFRAIRRDTAQELCLQENSFAIEQEMVMKCLQKNKKIMEFASWEKRRRYNRSHVVPCKMIWPYTLSLFKNIL